MSGFFCLKSVDHFQGACRTQSHFGGANSYERECELEASRQLAFERKHFKRQLI